MPNPETTDQLDQLLIVSQRELIDALRQEVSKLRGAISWIEPPFVDGETSVEELRKRVQFCVDDANRTASKDTSHGR